MLLLMRRPDEKIIIDTAAGERIVIMVTKIAGNQVTLGFDAPPDINIAREEIMERDGLTDYKALEE